jgi:trehalose 6-phosphate phosphatase
LAFALPGKGAALLRLQQFHNASRVIFVGDDETDEEVFQLNRLKSILGIRVGPEKGSAAQYFIDDQLQIDALLALILAA